MPIGASSGRDQIVRSPGGLKGSVQYPGETLWVGSDACRVDRESFDLDGIRGSILEQLAVADGRIVVGNETTEDVD